MGERRGGDWNVRGRQEAVSLAVPLRDSVGCVCCSVVGLLNARTSQWPASATPFHRTLLCDQVALLYELVPRMCRWHSWLKVSLKVFNNVLRCTRSYSEGGIASSYKGPSDLFIVQPPAIFATLHLYEYVADLRYQLSVLSCWSYCPLVYSCSLYLFVVCALDALEYRRRSSTKQVRASLINHQSVKNTSAI
jgi:hypothetical protein